MSAKDSMLSDHEPGDLTLTFPDRDDGHERRWEGSQSVRSGLVAYSSKTIVLKATQTYPIGRQHSVEFTRRGVLAVLSIGLL